MDMAAADGVVARGVEGQRNGSLPERRSAAALGTRSEPPDSSSFHAGHAVPEKAMGFISDRRRDAACSGAVASRRSRSVTACLERVEVGRRERLADIAVGGSMSRQPDRIAGVHTAIHWSRLPSTPCRNPPRWVCAVGSPVVVEAGGARQMD